MTKRQPTLEERTLAHKNRQERERKRQEKFAADSERSNARLAREFAKHWPNPPVGRIRMRRNISHPQAGLAWDRGLSTSGSYFTSAGSYMPRGSGVYEVERFLTADGKHGPLDQPGWGLEIRGWSQLGDPGVMSVQWLPDAMEILQ